MKQILARNIGLKILSLLLAVLLWVLIMNIDDPYITKTIDNIVVTKMNTNAVEENNKMYDVESGETATIKVRGKQSVIENLSRNDFVAVADFKLMSMTYAVPIQISLKETSRYTENDVEIMKQTEMMSLTLEDADSQTFRINVVTTGTEREGYYTAEAIATPNLIQISGSKKQIAKIKEVVVEVDVEGKEDSFQVTKTPVAYDENGYMVDSSKLVFETTEVQVDVTLLPTKEISLYVTQEGTPYYGYECTSIVYKPERITIAGTEEDLSSIYMLRIPFNVDGHKDTIISDISIEEYLDEKYILVDENKSVAVTAKIEKLDSKDIMVRTSDISVKNLSEEYEVVFITQGTITLRAAGLTEVLEQLNASDLKPYINLEGLGVGVNYVQVLSDANPNVTVRPATISIEIIEKEK